MQTTSTRPARARSGSLPRRWLTVLLGLMVALLPIFTSAPMAHAEDPAEFSLTKVVPDWEDGHEVVPGESFIYSITIGCTNIGSGGCTSAQLVDSLPDGLLLDGGADRITLQGASGDVSVEGNSVTVDFTDSLTDPVDGVGIPDGTTVVVRIPVIVDPEISPEQNGVDLTNTAEIDATNTDPLTDSFTVVPNVPIELAASTEKSFAPNRAVAVPGTETTLSLTGGNASNIQVDRVTLTDPSDPTATPNPFTYLGLTGDLDVTLPAGAEQVQVDVWVDEQWQEGAPSTPPATLPDGIDPAAVEGVRISFISTDDTGIAPAVSGSIDIGLVHRDTIGEAPEDPLTNEVAATVTVGEETSDPATATADYTLSSAELPLAAAKSFDPSTIAVGQQSTVTLGATNTSDMALESLAITEPGGEPNLFENGLTFDGWANGIQWPAGATEAQISYTLADGSNVELTATEAGTLPEPPAGTVTGFTVTFTGAIEAGAETSIPFIVTADEEQAAEEVEHPNTIGATSTALGGFKGVAEATDTLTTIEKRLAVEVDKQISPDEILSIPGEVATVQLTGHLLDFPDSTTDAHQLIVQDPADFENDSWWDAFEPTTVAATPIPAEATLTVQYWDGAEWVDVAGMVDLEGPRIFNGDLPADVQAAAQGIRFVYASENGFGPGTQVKPNLSFVLNHSVAGQELDIENCAASGATSPDASPADAAMAPPNCPSIHLTPPEPGVGDLVDKDWDTPKLIGERTGDEAGATLSWSTGSRSNLDEVVLSDVPAPGVDTLPGSVFDSFDLVRIDRITTAQDPLLTYDAVDRIELYSTSAGAWVPAPGDPCPASCDGTFPGYTVPGDLVEDTIAFRLVFVESPTRADRIGDDPTAPRVGSGVARSAGNDRTVHPVFRIRDELRSDADVPVIAAGEYNVDDRAGRVRNDVRVQGFTDGDQVVSDDASDIIAITNVPVTVDLVKSWGGGPLGVPEAGSAEFPDQYPTGRASLVATNTTPRKIDRLTITEPTGDTNPFDTFNLSSLNTITDPATIGADEVKITLELADGNTRALNRADALAADEAWLADVVGFEVVYTGRILEGAKATIAFDTRLRPETRENGDPVVAPTTVDNEATTLGEDLVDYPDVPSVTHDDHDEASIALQTQGIGLEVTKAFAPDTQTEPDREPVTTTLTAKPSGPSRTNWMQVMDEDSTFFNQYDFVDFGAGFTLTNPIDRVQVDVLTGGTFSAAGDSVELTGAAWVNGTPGATPTLPDGVSADQVQGLRFTFTRDDGRIWENPATPTQQIPLQVQRRETLHTGGPVLSDMVGNAPAPGEENAGEASNTIAGENRGADLVGGEPISATDDATALINYQRAHNAVEVTKSPEGGRSPSREIPYTLTYTNTGDVAITDPVITDRLPSDDNGPLLVFNPDLPEGGSPYAFSLAGAAPDPANGTPMPELGSEVTVAEDPTLLTFTFPEGTVLEVGQTYTIEIAMMFRPGLPGNTSVTNTTGITGERPWDGCEATLDDESGECRASATVHPDRAGALRGVKTVKAVDDELGVLNTRNDPAGCTPDDAGFHRAGCVPVTKPGGDEVWRMTFTNTGNLPQDKVHVIDRMPTPDDTGATTSLLRDSRWRPIPEQLAFTGVTSGTVSNLRVFAATDSDLCVDDLSMTGSCAEGDWTLIDEVSAPEIGATFALPADAVAFKVEADFATDLLQPIGTLSLDLTTITPAQSPDAGADTIAWNTVAAAARTNDGGQLGVAPRTEGNKVGVALATGPLAIKKVVDGEAADEFAPSTYDLDVVCTSQGESVELGADSPITVVADEPHRIDSLPWGSSCTVEDDRESSGASEFDATTVTIGRDDEVVPVVIATNTYRYASLELAKRADTSAVDQNGDPIEYGPFDFAVDCTFLGQPVYAERHGAEQPMEASFSSGDSVTFTQLPTGAECSAVETGDGGADETTSEATTDLGGADEQTTTSGESIELTLTADNEADTEGASTNLVTYLNEFPTAEVAVTKVIEGAGAEQYGAGPFQVRLSCVDDEGRSVWNDLLELGGENPLSATVDRIFHGASCTVTEEGTGGATTSVISPEGAFAVDVDNPATVTVTNTFELGAIKITKQIAGDGADEVSDDDTFTVQVQCVQGVNGADVPVAIEGDGRWELSRANGLVAEYDGLPSGAACTVTEPETGGADETTISQDRVVVGVDEVAEVEVVNTFNADPEYASDPTGPSEPSDPSDPSDPSEPSDPSDPGTPGPDDPGALGDTGGPGLMLGVLGILFLVSGAALLARRRVS